MMTLEKHWTPRICLLPSSSLLRRHHSHILRPWWLWSMGHGCTTLLQATWTFPDAAQAWFLGLPLHRYLLTSLCICYFFVAVILHPTKETQRRGCLFWITVWGHSLSQWRSHGGGRSRQLVLLEQTPGCREQWILLLRSFSLHWLQEPSLLNGAVHSECVAF